LAFRNFATRLPIPVGPQYLLHWGRAYIPMNLITLRVRFEVKSDGNNSVKGIQDWVNAMHRQLFEKGGSAYAVRRPGFVLIEATVPSVQFMEEWLHSCGEALARGGRDCSYTIISGVVASLSQTEIEMAESLRAEPVLLTRKFFFSLRTGMFLVSNIGRSIQEPSFGETVDDPEAREAQWRRIVDLKLSQRKCRVFPSEVAFREWADN
jgi:hypothetical protein